MKMHVRAMAVAIEGSHRGAGAGTEHLQVAVAVPAEAGPRQKDNAKDRDEDARWIAAESSEGSSEVRQAARELIKEKKK